MVMRRNAMGVNLRQSILKSLGRYIAIVLIIALGSAIFVGLVMTKSDMVLTGQDYMDRQNMFDIRLVSTYGWEREQVDKAARLPGVNGAEGVLYADLIGSVGEGSDSVYRFYALSDTMNRFSLRGGRMPESPDECLADGYVYGDSILGTTVTISDLNEEDALEDMACRSFTVVGYGASPLYMDMNRGTTSVGSGVLDAFFFVPQDAFQADYYTEIHLTLEEDYAVYSDEYNAYLEETIDILEPEAERLGDQRFASVKQIAETEYNRGYEAYLEGIQAYMDGRIALYKGLENGRERLEEGERELFVARNKLNESEKLLHLTEAQLDSGLKQINDYQAQLDQELANIPGYLAAAQQGIDRAKQNAEELLNQWNAAKNDPNIPPEQVDMLEQGYNLALSGITQAESAYNSIIYNRDVTIPAAYKEIEKQRAEIVYGWEEVNKGWAQLEKGWADVHEGEADIEQGWIDLEEARLEGEEELRDARQELRDAEEELLDARAEIDDLEPIDVFVLDRTSNTGYNSLDSTSDIVAGISKVLPVFFLLVASLVCITTMTRMIDEERTQIGTLKALGYSNAAIISKYLIYAGSGAVLGCGLGVAAGSIIFPKILWEAYKIMLYITEDVRISADWWLGGAVVGVYTAVILFVTWYCCRKALEEQPAELIRPKAPDPGKQLLVEKIPLWHRVSFLNKVMVRNIFRYRQRLAMMLVGIGGCTALLVTGFGVRDSIMGVVDYQYENVTVYDMEVYFTGRQSNEDQAEFLEEIRERADNAMFFHQSSIELTFGGVTKEIYLISAGEGLRDFIRLHSGQTPLSLPGENQVLLSIGVSEALGIGVGDTVTMRNADLQVLELTVSGIYDNHVNNYAIVSPQTIALQWGEAPEIQMAYIQLPEGTEPYALGADITGMDNVMNVSVSEDMAGLVSKMMQALNMIVVVIVFCAGLLAAIVLYNLTNININERIREIATIKVLGFNARETAAYVFKENLTLTVAGGIFGLFLGKLLLTFVMSKVRIDMVWFNTVVEPMSYVISFVMTILAAFVVNFVFYFKLDKINMAEALKSVE